MNLLGKIFRKLLLSNPSFWEKYDIQITPDHFYYPVPSSNDIPPNFFERCYECIGINWNYDEQHYYLATVFGKYCVELAPNQNLKMMSSIDAAVYFSLIRHHRPKKIIEIGSGESTRIAASACVANRQDGYPCELICIEPFPNDDLVKGFDGLSGLIKKKVQDMELSVFDDVDVLFIDSSHVVKIGSDVVWEILEIVPRLKPGCLIHWHDIFIPGEYLEEWVRQRLFWSEQYLLRAFLMYNRDFGIIWASNLMNKRSPALIRDVFRGHAMHKYPLSSFWVRRNVLQPLPQDRTLSI